MMITHCQSWVDSVIVRMNICPFAKAEVASQRVNYVVAKPDNTEQYLAQLLRHCQQLDQQPEIATTLMLFSDPFLTFADYLDLVTQAEDVLYHEGYEGVYQLASFHPDYCFADSNEQDAANFTNKAPYPILHLIREGDITKALANFLRPEQIPERNIEYTRRKGLSQMQDVLRACYDAPQKK
ncbi:DUF1415 domain-containing protein [Alteromonadales bacterium alter-6D02]|nr:DUF1415 domain-containing protein [Alteromonadales bacterium alter-6D02]